MYYTVKNYKVSFLEFICPKDLIFIKDSTKSALRTIIKNKVMEKAEKWISEKHQEKLNLKYKESKIISFNISSQKRYHVCLKVEQKQGFFEYSIVSVPREQVDIFIIEN